MTRPNNKHHRGRTLPMSAMNGGTDPRIPPDIEWDAENPPVIYSCSQHTEHMPGCDGSCNLITITENQCKLVNEARAWARLGMNFLGLPTSMQNFPVSGINVELFDNECRSHALKELLIEVGVFTQEEFDERFRQIKFEVMHGLRTENERAVKEARTKEMLGIGEKKLLGPDGKQLG